MPFLPSFRACGRGKQRTFQFPFFNFRRVGGYKGIRSRRFFKECREDVFSSGGDGGATCYGIGRCRGGVCWYDVCAVNVVKAVIENAVIGFGIVKVVIESNGVKN